MRATSDEGIAKHVLFVDRGFAVHNYMLITYGEDMVPGNLVQRM